MFYFCKRACNSCNKCWALFRAALSSATEASSFTFELRFFDIFSKAGEMGAVLFFILVKVSNREVRKAPFEEQ